MILGFVGTGKIASSVITGICKSNLKYKKIIISPRNKQIAQSLKKKFKKIVIAKNNQQIVDQSTWVFLSVTPTVGDKIIKDLKFKSTQTVVSFISTITLSQLKKAIKVKAKVVRAIPLPPISLKKGPVPICPPNSKVKAFFNHLGTTVEIKNEKSSINFWSTSVITGISKSNTSYKKIIISPRNKKIAQSLKRKFKKIVIAKDNQQIVDQSNWVFLSCLLYTSPSPRD